MKKKIAFFTITLSSGGAERVISNLLLNLPDEKYEKYLILLDADQVVYASKGKLINLKTFKKNNGVFKLLNIFFSYYKLKHIKKEFQLETVISFLDIPNFLNILTKKNERNYVSVRTYVTESYKGLRGLIYKNVIRFFYNTSDKVIAVSKECKEDLIINYKLKGQKVISIPNFYNLDEIEKMSKEPLEKEYESYFRKKVIINTGRLSCQKGQKYLIEAFSNLENKEEYNLLILGEGKLRKELESQIKSLELEDQIFLLGFQKNPFKFLKRSYLYVFPSFYEGFPNGLAEAMACGLPVISNNCKSGPSELLDNGKYGILINNFENTDILANSLKERIKFLEKKETYDRYKALSLERIKFFSKEEILKNWEEILQN